MIIRPQRDFPNSRIGSFMGGELRRGWKALIGSVLGISAGIIALPAAAISISMHGLQADFGWSRTQISFASAILISVLIFTSPVIGWLTDRISEAWIATFSLMAMACSFVLLSRTGGDISVFLGGFALMALVGSGASTIPFARIINANFVQSRGLALGLAMSGTGISAMVLPLFLVPFVALHGWRAGFLVLAAIAAIAAPIILTLLGPGRGVRTTASVQTDWEQSGSSLLEAVHGRLFWTMAAAFALIALGAVGIMVHFVAMLTDAGLSPISAGSIAGFAGAATIVVRIATGWLIDRMFAPRVAATMMFTAAVCLVAFDHLGAPAAPLAAIAFGLAIGAEIDLIAYLCARYFGLRAYGRIYSVLYSAILLGSALSPVMYGLIADATRSYHWAILAGAGLLALSAFLLLSLPGYRHTVVPHSDSSPALPTGAEIEGLGPRRQVVVPHGSVDRCE